LVLFFKKELLFEKRSKNFFYIRHRARQLGGICACIMGARRLGTAVHNTF
jgi:hypothetical protein